jgi:hypothetical protein
MRSNDMTPRKIDSSSLTWRRDGDSWVLLAGRRRPGRVVPDAEHPGMWRSVKSRGRLSDMANLSWAKNAVLVAAERELEWEAQHQAATTPIKAQQTGGVFTPASPLVSQSEPAAISLPSSL